MYSVYIQKQKRYTKDDLLELFKLNIEETNTIIRKLREYDIIQSVNNTDFVNSYSIGYVFNYVGIIIIRNIVLKCYPKYLKDTSNIKNDLRQVMHVIKKYVSTHDFYIENEFNDEYQFNLLSVILEFINDYYENGIYQTTRDIVEVNGDGEILWDTTINNNNALIYDNRPYYDKLSTQNEVNDTSNYFKLLHEFILTDCSRELEKVDVLDLFGYTHIYLSDRTLDEFGDITDILNTINLEINVEYNTRKRDLLKLMYYYISKKELFSNDVNNFSLYGTKSYNLIWEKICSYVLNDKKDEKLININLPKPLNSKYNPNDSLLSLIEKPTWNITHNNLKHTSTHTLIPDIISIYNHNNMYDFIIFDAKYYDLKIDNGKLTGQPRIESITKQYLYELAYKEFIELHNFNNSINCFLIPTQKMNIINYGFVELKFLHDTNLNNIQIILLPASIVNQLYLDNKKLDIKKLCII